MHRLWVMPPAGLCLALAGVGAVSYLLSVDDISPARRAVLALPDYRVYPDCQPADARLDHTVLACWIYGDRGAWRIDAFDSAHHALVVHLGVTNADVIDEAARHVVSLAGQRFDEVLVYASVLPVARVAEPAADVTITRVRWTSGSGYSRLEFQAPR